MKLNLLNLKTRQHLKHSKSARVSTPFRKVTEIGILFSAEDRLKHEVIKDFVKSLELEGKKVQVISFLPNKKENFEFMFNFFTEKDVSFWGNMISRDVMGFIRKPFDYLFCLDMIPNPYILNVLAQSNAKCRVGPFWPVAHSYFELMISNVTGTKSLITEAYKYTKELR